MRMKKVLAGIMAAALVMSTAYGVGSIKMGKVNAQELTQIENPNDVDYGNHGAEFTAEDLSILESMFDVQYYLDQNPDLYNILNDLGYRSIDDEAKALVFKHFYTCGIFEGRSLSADFNVSVFASANKDLKNAFGKDVMSYYRYAATHDLAAEGRTITTLKQAAAAGITVSSISNEAITVTPAVYYKAEALGIRNLGTVMVYVSNNANKSSDDSNSSNTPASAIIGKTVDETVDNVQKQIEEWDKNVREHKIGSIDEIKTIDYAGDINSENSRYTSADGLQNLIEDAGSFTCYIVCDSNGKYGLTTALGNGNVAVISDEGYQASTVAVNSDGTPVLYDQIEWVVVEEESTPNRYCHRVFDVPAIGEPSIPNACHVAPHDAPISSVTIAGEVHEANSSTEDSTTQQRTTFYLYDSTGEVASITPSFDAEDVQNALAEDEDTTESVDSEEDSTTDSE